MQVPESFYKDGVVGGFYVSSMMKRAWCAQVEILEDIAKLCDKYGIKYYADAGTLIGAVRHGGFIPWDDDLDIVMMREDYEEFLSHRDELPDNYRMLNWRSDVEWEDMFSRVVNTDKMEFDPDFLKKYHGLPFSAGVDIFVNDYLYKDEVKEQQREDMFNAAVDLAKAARDKTAPKKTIMSNVERLEALSGYRVDKRKGLAMGLFEVAEKLLREVRREDADKAVFMPAWIKYKANIYDIGWYDDAIPMDFLFSQIMVPVGYDKILKNKYGDYLRVVRQGGMHNYPYYVTQMELLTEQTGWKPPLYKCEKEEMFLGDKIKEAKQQQIEGLRQQVFQIESLMSMQGNSEIFAELTPQVEALKTNIALMENGNDEVVFLPYGSENWKYMQPLWEKEMAASDDRIVVLPLPIYDMNMDGSTGEMHYDLGSYPNELDVVSIEEYDLATRKPKRIYYQAPYDGYNPSASVHPYFYSNELLRYTDELVYVPLFVVSDIEDGDEKGKFTLGQFVKMPGTVHADRILVSEEYMKRIYVDALMELCGKESRDIWEKRIEVVEDLFMTEEQKKEGKAIFYYTDICPFLTEGDVAIDKLQRNLEIFKESSEDVRLVWHPYPRMEEYLSDKAPHIFEKYKAIVDRFISEGWGKYDKDGDGEESMSHCSAYYGDPSPYIYQAQMEKKPVMVADIHI